MLKDYATLLLFAHVIGDFYIQTQSQAKRKAQSMKWVWLHCLFYWLVVLLLSCVVLSGPTLLFGTAAALAHTLIDVLKYLYTVRFRKKPMTIKAERNVFFADQALHLLCIILIAYFFVSWQNTLQVVTCARNFQEISGLSARVLLKWAFALTVIAKPLNLAISFLLAPYKPEEKKDETPEIKAADKNAGRFIGILERTIIIVFISLGQYAAIGLVLTAKSIARYDKISKDPAFAEYYLLGTLLSTLAAVGISFVF